MKARAIVAAAVMLGFAACSHASRAAAGSGKGPLDGPPQPFRRVVTGLDAAGRSTITSDGPVPKAAQASFSPEEISRMPALARVSVANALWTGGRVPVDLQATADPVEAGPGKDWPPASGFAAGIVRYEPGLEYPMHATRTLDLVVMLAGALELRVETGTTIVRAGDVVVQRGTVHGWKVVGDEPAIFFGILLDAKALPAAAR